jgi:hypothetical protein
MVFPSIAREDLAALADELTLLVDQIPDGQLRTQALATLVRLSTLHGQVIDAFDRAAKMAALEVADRVRSGAQPARS